MITIMYYFIVKNGIYLTRRDLKPGWDPVAKLKLSLYAGKPPANADIKNIAEVCTMLDGSKIFAVFLTPEQSLPPKAVLLKADSPITWAVHHAIVIFEVKSQLTQIATSFDMHHESEKNYTYKLLGVLERIFARGLEHKSWIGSTADSENLSKERKL